MKRKAKDFKLIKYNKPCPRCLEITKQSPCEHCGLTELPNGFDGISIAKNIPPLGTGGCFMGIATHHANAGELITVRIDEAGVKPLTVGNLVNASRMIKFKNGFKLKLNKKQWKELAEDLLKQLQQTEKEKNNFKHKYNYLNNLSTWEFIKR